MLNETFYYVKASKNFDITWSKGLILYFCFEDAVKTCTDESLEADKRIAICFPLYRNMIALLKLLER